jgi:hypothetical protein
MSLVRIPETTQRVFLSRTLPALGTVGGATADQRLHAWHNPGYDRGGLRRSPDARILSQEQKS